MELKYVDFSDWYRTGTSGGLLGLDKMCLIS